MCKGKSLALSGATVVLDTNVVLDWLVFDDVDMRRLADAITQGQVRWLMCPAMRTELGHQLSKTTIGRFTVDCERALASIERYGVRRPAPEPLAYLAPSCRDPDDQIFVDLALSERATWLVSRDKALLALSRRVAAAGLQVLAPRDWPGRGPGPG